MRAKSVNEEVNFERGQDPKRAMDIGIPPPSMDQILDIFLDDPEDEAWAEVERFVNEYLIDRIYMKYPNADSEKVKSSIQIMIKEILDTWEQTTQE